MGKRWIKVIKAVLVYSIFFSVFACSNSIFVQHEGWVSQEATKPVDPTTTSYTKVSLMLDRYPNAMHAFIYTAIANGYFREEGIELEIRQPAEPDEGVTLVGLDIVNLTLTSQPRVLVARASNQPVISIATIVRRPLNYLMVPKASVIQTPKNLASRKVGYPGDAVNMAILRTMVLADGGNPDQVIRIDVKQNYIQSLSSHQVDAIVGGNINQDRILLANRMQPVRAIEPMLYGVPEYYELVLAANERMVETEPELLATIWAILARGQQDVIDNPEQAIQHVMNNQNKAIPLSMKVELESLSMLLPMMSGEEDEFGSQSKTVWSEVGKWLEETGLMASSINSEEAYFSLVE